MKIAQNLRTILPFKRAYSVDIKALHSFLISVFRIREIMLGLEQNMHYAILNIHVHRRRWRASQQELNYFVPG